MVVGAVNHPRLDERVRAGQFLHYPRARLCQRRERARHFQGLPLVPVDQARERVLELVVDERLGLAQQQRQLGRQRGAALDHPRNGVHQIVQMHERLSVRPAAGIEPARQLPLRDALNVMRQRNRVAEIVVDAGDAQEHGRNLTALLPDESLGENLRRRVRPCWLQRPVFIDELPRLSRAMHEHGAREDKLLDLEAEVAQPAQQASGAAHGDFVLFARLAEEIVVGSEMNHRGDVRPVMVSDGTEPVPHTLVGRDVDRNIHAARRRRLGRLAVEPDDILEAPGEPSHHGVADPSVGATDDDDPALRLHGLPSRPVMEWSRTPRSPDRVSAGLLHPPTRKIARCPDTCGATSASSGALRPLETVNTDRAAATARLVCNGQARRPFTASPVPPRPTDPDFLLASPVPVSARPRDGEEKYAVFKGLEVVRQALVECEQTARAQIERPSERPQPDVAPNSVDRDSSLCSMSRNPRVRLECGQDHPKVVVLHKRLGVLATRRLGLTVELLELPRQIEFQKGSGHRLRVRSPGLTVLVMSI
jgi:hypothetical protein